MAPLKLFGGEGGCVGALILWGWEGEGRGGGVGIYMEKGKRRSYAITGLLGSGGMLFSRAGKEGGGGGGGGGNLVKKNIG